MKKACGVLQRGMRLTAALLVGTLASLLCAHAAQADRLSLGSHYNYIDFTNHGSVGGGSIDPSFLDGNALAFVYCADIYTHVNVPASYDTYVSTDGYIHKTSLDATGIAVTNMDRVAWLLENYAFGAVANPTQQQALQAAIWHEIYGGFTPSDLSVEGFFDTYVRSIPVDVPNTEHTHIQWLSPVYSDGRVAQGLITITNAPINNATIATPEPSSWPLLATGCAGLLAYGWRRWRRAA